MTNKKHEQEIPTWLLPKPMLLNSFSAVNRGSVSPASKNFPDPATSSTARECGSEMFKWKSIDKEIKESMKTGDE